jgi:hypothetical protein
MQGQPSGGAQQMSIEIKAGPAYRSYSSFTSWLACGKAWQLARLVDVKEQPAWWFAGGKAVHTATEHHDLRLFEAEGR